MVSAWDTAAAAPWARQLQALLPQAGFQGKGLWATEGVVTSVSGRYPLAYMSHVYEFIDAHDGRVLLPLGAARGSGRDPAADHGQRPGALPDERCAARGCAIGTGALLHVLGRNDGVDLVGEKTSATTAQAVACNCKVHCR